MNVFEFVLGIVIVGGLISILRARYGGTADGTQSVAARDPDADRMREEIKALKERIAVLERLATDTNSAVALDREIEKLR